MRIALLGPMVVAGRRQLQLRDRTVLGVLLVRSGAVVTMDEISEALWGGEQPASARKVVQGSVVRLRRLLGKEAIRTTDAGYVLQVPEADTDAGRFSALVAEARRQLEASHADRAARSAQEALTLWRGDPLPELEGWPPAAAEAARLTAMRDTAHDVQVEGLLRAGRGEQAVPLAARLAEAAPFQEPRWARWARALYAAGRQADALDVLARLRAGLSTELGIDAGQEIADLEVAILRQEPALEIAPAPAVDVPCPWPGLLPYEVGDALWGRDEEVLAALGRLTLGRALVVVGRSGVGKSSFARAGLAPHLSATVITPGPRPTTALAAVSSADVVVDQAEELLTQCTDADERRRFLDVLSSWPGRVIVVARAHLLDELGAYGGFATLLERGVYVLRPLDERGLRRVVEGPAEAAGVRLEPGLVDLLLAECQEQSGALPLLSHVLAGTWRGIEGNTLTVHAYRATGGVRRALASTAEGVYLALAPNGRDEMRRLFRRLVSTEGGEVLRSRVPRDVVDPTLLESLLTARLVSVADDGSVQVAHETLVSNWPRLDDWLAEDVAGQRILRHLSAEAREWAASGRPRDSLYRGVRLGSAVAWSAGHGAELTPVERAFLAASQEAADGEMRRTRATNARLRLALGAAVLLLVAALVGAGLAVQQARQAGAARDSAREATSLSEGLRLGEVAQAQEDPSVALGLAAEALATDDSEETRVRVLETFDNFAALVSTGGRPPVPWPRASRAVTSPDGTLSATATLTHVVIGDAGSGEVLRKLAAPSNGPTALAFSPDGRLVAAGMSEPGYAGTGVTAVWDVDTGAELGRFDSGDGAVRAHVFAEDGSSVWSRGEDGTHQWDLSGSNALVRTHFGEPTSFRAGDVLLSLWDGSVETWIEVACRLAGRPLTQAEWRQHLGARPYRPTCR